MQSLTQMACDARMMDTDARAITVQTIAGHMEDALEIRPVNTLNLTIILIYFTTNTKKYI